MAMEIRTVMSYEGGDANGRGPEEIHREGIPIVYIIIVIGI